VPSKLTLICVVTAGASIGLAQPAVAAPPQCLTNLVANVFAGNPTVLPPAPCSDPDGDALTLILVSGPDHGVLGPQAADGSRIYTAAADYVGNDVVRFKANDGTSDSGISTLTINVQAPPAGSVPPSPENHAPVAVVDTLLLASVGRAGRINVLANDTDPDGDQRTVVSWTKPKLGRARCAAGRCTYTPGTGFHGNDSFQYTISDGRGATATTRVKVRLKPTTKPDRHDRIDAYAYGQRTDEEGDTKYLLMGFDMARELYTTIRASVSIDDFLAKCAARQLIRALKCTRGSIPGLAFGLIYKLAEDAALKQAMNNRIMGANHGANDCWGIRYQYGLTGWKVQMDPIESDVARKSLWKWHHINTFLSCTSAGTVRQLPGVPAD
jgi:Bacterial Ig domain